MVTTRTFFNVPKQEYASPTVTRDTLDVPKAQMISQMPRRLLIALAAYFGSQVLIRLLASPTATLDETEQLIFTQAFQWGYGPQPPLYTWLQILFFKCFGPSLLGLSLFKNLLLFAIYAFTFATARRVTRNNVTAAIATAALILIPQIGWESQRDLTHSVLATAVTAATVFLFLKFTASRNTRYYFVLGACFAAGMLSNYNFALIIAGLCIAALLVREYRALVLTPRFFLTLITATLLLLPHIIWAATHPEMAFATMHKMRIAAEPSWFSIIAAPIVRLPLTLLTHTGSLFLIFAVLCWRQLLPFPREVMARPEVRFIGWLIATVPLLVLVFMMVVHATAFKGRWLQPLYILLPVLLAALITPRLNRPTARRLFGAVALAALGISTIFIARMRWPDVFGVTQDANAPFDKLTAQFQEKLRRADFIVADDNFVGGNLRLLSPNKPVVTPQFPRPQIWKANKRCVVVFDARKNGNPPAPLRELISLEFPSELAEATVSYVTAPMRFQPTVSVRLGVMELPEK